jgi:glutamate synthase (ferredoxin)
MEGRVMVQNTFDIPHDFNKVCDFEIPETREYAVGMVLCQRKKPN